MGNGGLLSRARHAAAMPSQFRRACGDSTAQGIKAFFVRGLSAAFKTSLPPIRMRFRPSGFARDVFVRLGTTDCKILEELFIHGTYEEIGRLGMPANPVIVDLGANTGLACAYFLHHYPKARVIAVEPDVANGEMFRLNTNSGEADGRVTLVRGFIAASEGVADIDRRNGACGFRKCQVGEGGGESIPCMSMNRLLADSGVVAIDLLKCDIEGGEAELFPSCGDWIGRVRYLAIECHGEYVPSRLYADLEKCGFAFDVLAERSDGVCLLKRKDGAGGPFLGQ